MLGRRVLLRSGPQFSGVCTASPSHTGSTTGVPIAPHAVTTPLAARPWRQVRVSSHASRISSALLKTSGCRHGMIAGTSCLHAVTSDAIREQLTAEQVPEVQDLLPGWTVDADADGKPLRLRRRFEFPSFTEAWTFMSAVAVRADELDHHPDWSNVYNRVDVTLNTHTCNGVTSLDVTLASYMETAAREAVGQPSEDQEEEEAKKKK
eukprot:TRINITY_DN13307_c0_g1_i1.p1 TRINITY_DN13307_c0_g1~~TRINITY_DN13307_c0_g1_i1.p1  ORF type:complete len:207 (-),score=19.09 TRINITY_DN13307_c0_g1_i1:219-839(-)